MSIDSGSYIRIDWSVEILSYDEATGKAEFSMCPDPRRYEVIEDDGDVYYKDIFQNIIIPQRLIAESAPEMEGMPIYADFPSIKSTQNYVENRKDALKKESLLGKYIEPEERPKKHKELCINDNLAELSFVSVDICNSTRYKKKWGVSFDKIVELFIREMGTVIGQFNGTILKTTGDGFIAYNDFYSVNTQVDNILGMCDGFLALLNEAINTSDVLNGIDKLEIRIGVEHGLAKIHEIFIPTTGYKQNDINSDAINRAVKLQESAPPNSIHLGEAVYQRAHTNWLIRCRESNISIADSLGLENYSSYIIE